MTNRPWLRLFASIAVAAWVSSAALGQSGQSLLDGTTPPGIAPGAALSGQPLSNLEMINLFSGALNLSVPVLSIGGRGEVGYSLKVPVETRWVDNIVPNGLGGPNAYFDYFGGQQGMGDFSPGYLEIRRGVDEGTCSDSTTYELYVLTRLHWIQANGDDQVLIDLKSGGTAEPTNICSGVPTVYARGREFVSNDGSGITFKIDDSAPEATDEPVGFAVGFLLLKNGTRYRIESGRVQWMEDRNGNRITFDRGNDVYKRPVTITDPLGRAITIEYGSPPGYTLHQNEDWIKFPGASSAQRIIKIRSTSLSDHLLRDGGATQTFAQLFRNGNYAPGVGAEVSDPILIKEIEFPNGQKYQFLYNQYGELSRVTLPTGGKVEYEWASGTSDPDGLFGPMIYRRLQQRRSYTLSGVLEGTTVYSVPSPPDTAPNLIVQTNEKDSAGHLTEKYGFGIFWTTSVWGRHSTYWVRSLERWAHLPGAS